MKLGGFPMRHALSLLLLSAAAFAQSERGNITGIVTDPTGATIAGAELSVVNRDTNAVNKATSTASGEFNIPNLLPGTYRLEVTSSGFKRYIQQNLVLNASATVRVDAQLQLGAVADQVEVTAQAVSIQTDNAKVTTQVENRLVDELPLVVGGAMRSPFNLVQVAAEARGGGTNLSIGGGQAAAWDATLDGHSVGTNRSADAAEAALNTPSVEALTEFSVDTNGFKAEYGQAGGGVMTFASKSGTNKFHGSVYNFLRNDALDARGFFAARRSIYRQNDYGFTASGPVVLPELYNGRNKTFFFVSYEGFRNRVGANNTILTVPTPEMFNGDFRQWVTATGTPTMIPIYDPATTRAGATAGSSVRDVFAGNQVPVTRFSTTAAQLAAIGKAVQPNRGFAPGTSNYVRQNYLVTGGTMVTPTDKWSIKGDHVINDRHRVSILWNDTSFFNKPGPAGAPGLPEPLWNGQIQDWQTEAWRGTHDWTISNTMVNHLSYHRNTFTKNSYSANVDKGWKDKVCIRNVVDCNQNFPVINFTDGFTGWGSASYNGTDQPGWGLKDDLSYIRGKHTFKFGFHHQNQNANGFGQQDIAGRADFSFLSTAIPGNVNFPTSGGSSFASMLLGQAFLGRTETIRYVNQKFPYFGFYAQDDWRLTRKISLNLGLRYDLTLAPRNGLDEYSDLNPTRPNPAAGNIPGALWFAGTGPGREGVRSLVPNWYGGWGPRIGIAYTPDQKTTFRTAFGRSFSRVTAVAGSGHFAGFIGQYVFNNTSQGVQPTFLLDQGLPAYPLPPRIDPSFSNGNDVDYWQGQEATRAPENLFWTFTIQRQLTNSTVMEVGYNATVGTHLQTGLLNFNQVPTAIMNQMISQLGGVQAFNVLRGNVTAPAAVAAGIQRPYPTFTGTAAQALRPFPQYQNIQTAGQNGDKSGHSSYHALIVKVDRRLSRSLIGQWSYVFSKIITDSDTYYANGGLAMDHYNRRLEKSIGANDRTHSLKLTAVYNMPFGKGERYLTSGPLAWIAGGWRLSGIFDYTSGAPLALTRNNPLPIFNGSARPQIDSYDGWRAPIKGEKFDPAVDTFFKPASQFPAQPGFGYGNATRFNPRVRSFSGKNENVSIARTFRVTEGIRIDLRGEAFNVFNRTIFGTGSNNLNTLTFGQVTNQANTPRQMQVGLKVYF